MRLDPAFLFGPVSRVGRVLRWLRRHLLSMFVVLGLIALALSLIGTYQHFAATPESFTWTNVVFFASTLFLADGTMFEGGGQFPPALEIARFLAPLATAVGVADAASTLFAHRFEQFRARHARRHVVVCGSGPTASALVDKLVGSRRVVLVAEDAEREYPDAERPPNLLRINGDPAELLVLQGAGVARADVIYSCLADTASNLAVTLTARAVLRAGRTRARFRRFADARADNPLRCLAQVGDLSLLPHLRARWIGLEGDPGFRLDFFAVEVLGAHSLLNSNAPAWSRPGHDDTAPHHPPHLVVLGTSGLGQAVVMELARRWRDNSPAGGPLLCVVLCAPDASVKAAAMRSREPALGRVTLLCHDSASGDLPPELVLISRAPGEAPTPPEFVYVCHREEEEALLRGLEVVRAVGAGSLGVNRTRIVVRTGRQRSFEDVFGPREPTTDQTDPAGDGGLLDNVGGGLRFFAVNDEALPLDPGANDLIENFAQIIHEKYLAKELAAGAQIGSRRGLRPWAELAPDLQASNRAQAIGYSEVLRRRNWMLVPLGEHDPEFVFTEEEVEQLAPEEHLRWRRERESRGMRFGPTEQDGSHPSLIEWESLSAEDQDRSRAVVLNMPAVLAAADLGIVRMMPRPPDPTV
ncbi:NAD-binding protein [Parafrankia sp. EUN1f]|uniref:NAD-binding protein n=1 Tax=Parafrankia sp. EUN1f TaxID=102897 RepID=UPI0001C45219|nr:NAD-binding protein [Parafrankia sp. EUN1f]EFC82405.1 TrkA-N domain protein [Parafrankia sp. EUN1f]